MQLITACRGILQVKPQVHKTRSIDLDELKQRLRTEWANYNWITSSLWQPFVSCVVAYQRASRLVKDFFIILLLLVIFVAHVDDVLSVGMF